MHFAATRLFDTNFYVNVLDVGINKFGAVGLELIKYMLFVSIIHI